MSNDDDYMKALEIQRRNFEAQFGSIEDMGYKDKSKAQDKDCDEEDSDSEEDNIPNHLTKDSDDEDDFSGFGSNASLSSDEEEDDEESEQEVKPKVIKINDSFSTPPPSITNAERKIVRSGRAPTLAEMAKKEQELSKMTKKQQAKAAKEDDENLENDLKLQRLLKESHILANQLDYSGADLTLQTIDYEDPTGKARRRALDSRIRSLAANSSSTGGLPKTLEKMPMNMRKGMIKSNERKVAQYEQEAKDAGIILSKVKKGDFRDLNQGKGSTSSSDRLGTGNKVEKKHRQKGLKINAVGRSTRNGLVISQNDIDRINNKGKRTFKKKGGSGRK